MKLKNISKRSLILILAIYCALSVMLVIGVSASDGGTGETPTLEVAANNVSYADSVYILYAIKTEGFQTNKNEVKMLFWYDVEETYELGTEDYSSTNRGSAHVNGSKCLVFYSEGLSAKKMSDDIYARACVTVNGTTYYSEVVKFSVLEYVLGMKEKGGLSSSLNNLLDSMLSYGTAAQNNFNHNTNRPANGKYYKVTVEGGTLPDGFTKGRYLQGEQVVITANDPAPGMRFSHWINKDGIIVSYDKELEITVGNKNLDYTAVYKDVSSVSTQLELFSEITYDADVEDIYLPTAVAIEIDGRTILLEVVWNTDSFKRETVGVQKLYATLVDTSAYFEYGIEPGCIFMSVTTLPYTYEIDTATGYYTLTGYYGNERDVVIPTSYNNTFITTIAAKAFNNVASIKNISVPSSVTKIESGAFWYCDGIESITLPFIGESATSSNSWLGWIFGSTSYSVQQGLLPLALKSVTLAEGATKVPDYAFYNCTQIEDFNTPSSITHLGSQAFYNCLSLTEFTLPDNLNYYRHSFDGCTNLKRINVSSVDMLFHISTNWTGGSTSILYGRDLYCNGKLVIEITIPRDVKTVNHLLNYCTSIRKIYVPNTVSEIRQDAFNFPMLESVIFEEGSKITKLSSTFEGCKMLKAVDLSPLTELKELSNTFNGCTSLTEVILPESITSIGGYTFCSTDIRSIVLPEGIQSIGEDCFRYCYNLESVVIPTGVVSIGSYAFYNCSSLKEINLPESLVTIGNYAFYGCRSIVSLRISSRVYEIGSEAFAYCYSLVQVVIESERLTTVGNNAFTGCYKLYEVYNASGVEVTLGSTDNGYLGYYAKTVHTSLEAASCINIDGNGFVTYYDGEEAILCGYIGDETDIVLPSDIEGQSYSIAPYAFYQRTDVTSVTIGDSVTTIGECAFYYCTSLTSVTIGDNVTSVGKYAFSGCYNLLTVTLGKNVQTVKDYAFDYCYRLVEVYNLSSLSITAGNSSNGYIGYYALVVHNSLDEASCFDITENGYIFCTKGENVYLVGYTGYETALTLPETYNGKGYEINSYAFYNCTNLTSVTIGDNVTSIGYEAFYYCTSLTSVTIGDSVTSIGELAFYNCASLTSVTIGDNVTSIGRYAFSDCNKLYTEYENGRYVGNAENPYAVLIGLTNNSLTSYTIHNDTKIIAYGAFRGCDVKSIVIPDSVTSIGEYAFCNCTSLTSVVIGDSVTSIGDSAFDNCTSLTSVTIGDGVTSIGDSAFYNCTSLTSVTIGDGVTSIGDSAFYNCTSLTAVYITDIASWCNIEFYNQWSTPLLYAKNLYLNGELVTDLVIPEGVTSIGDHAFCNCESLTSVTIGDSVTSISYNAFYNCTSLTSVTIPDSVTSIGEWAFYMCSSLTVINYRGSEEQWKAISKGYGWNSSTGSYTIIYNYTED